MGCRIMVLGGGFAGLSALDRLSRHEGPRSLDLHLIDSCAESVFSPLLPDLISARLRSERIMLSIEPYCRRRGTRFSRARVIEVDTQRCRVVTDRGTHEADFLLLCLGCETNYFGNETASAHAPGLKSIAEGHQIRRRALELYGRAVSESKRGRFFVVGGGYTGFEAASHLAFLLARRAGVSLPGLTETASVEILEKADEPLRNCSPTTRDWACELMKSWGIRVRTGMSVEEIDQEGNVRLSDDEVVSPALVVWAAGVTPGPAVAGIDAPRVAGGRLGVDAHLRVGESSRVFAAGDVAGPTPSGDGRVLRMSVQFSLMGGLAAAENALRAMRDEPLHRFSPLDPGYIVPLAPWRAAGVVLGRELRGKLPSALHYFMCVFRTWSWQDRLGIVQDLCRKGPRDEQFER